jgi:hypothetical protein
MPTWTEHTLRTATLLAPVPGRRKNNKKKYFSEQGETGGKNDKPPEPVSSICKSFALLTFHNQAA